MLIVGIAEEGRDVEIRQAASTCLVYALDICVSIFYPALSNGSPEDYILYCGSYFDVKITDRTMYSFPIFAVCPFLPFGNFNME